MSDHIITSCFDPTNTHLALAVQALDSHQIKVQAVVTAQDSLNTSFSLAKGAKVTAMEWISPNLVALCLSNGSILIYSPAVNNITEELESPFKLAITAFHFSPITNTAWSSDIDGNLFEWDLVSYSLLQKFALADLLDSVESISKLSTVMYQNEPHLLVGTHNVYLVDTLAKAIVKSFPAHAQPIISITPVTNDPDLFLTAAEGDRFINVYSISRNSTRTVLVAQSPIQKMALGVSSSASVVAAITESGTIEVFNNPLSFGAQPQESSKKRRKQLASSVLSRHSNANIKYSRPIDEIRNPDDENLAINAISASENVLHISWLENMAMSCFDALAWFDNSGFPLAGSTVIRRSRQELRHTSHTKDGHDVAAPKLYSESHTVITEGGAFQNELENVAYDEDDEETLADRLEKLTGGKKTAAAAGRKKLGKHTAGTLTVVLSQALRNNDHSLLETVLTNRDPTVVQQTITKLESSLVVILLDKLAERMTRQQSRFDQLNFWLKWIIIIHGGVLSSMPNLTNKLASLHAVLIKKASTLPRLLELQGRLNMIEQQNELRKEILKVNSTHENFDDAETDVEYVEEIDDAIESGILGEDDGDEDDGDDDDSIDMDAADDYDELENGKIQYDSYSDEDGLSDVETAVEHNDILDQE